MSTTRTLPTARPPDPSRSRASQPIAIRRDDDFQLTVLGPAGALDGAREVRILAERSGRGYRDALVVSGQLRERLGPEPAIEVYRTPLPIPGASFADHMSTMKLLGGEPSPAQALERLERVDAAQLLGHTGSARDVLLGRTGLIDAFLSRPAPAIDWVVEGLFPSNVEGGIVAAGGTGKGLVEIMLALHVALGRDCGPFNVPRPRGVVLLALEDDVATLHRRFEAALAVHFPELTSEGAEQLRERLEVKPLRGAAGAILDDDFVEAAIAAAQQVPDVGLIFLDPLTRGLALPEGAGLNSQEGGGATIRQLGRISAATGASVVFAHHVNKQSQREGTELHATAATGSKQIVDLSRVVINLRRLTDREAQAYGLDATSGGRFIELRVSKTNGPEPKGGPFILEVLPQGAVRWRQEAHGRELTDCERVFEVIERLCEEKGRAVTRDEILASCRGQVGKVRASAAWNDLASAKVLVRRERGLGIVDPETGKPRRVDTFEPAERGAEILHALSGRGEVDGLP